MKIFEDLKITLYGLALGYVWDSKLKQWVPINPANEINNIRSKANE